MYCRDAAGIISHPLWRWSKNKCFHGRIAQISHLIEGQKHAWLEKELQRLPDQITLTLVVALFVIFVAVL